MGDKTEAEYINENRKTQWHSINNYYNNSFKSDNLRNDITNEQIYCVYNGHLIDKINNP
jgi:hypothetical protein